MFREGPLEAFVRHRRVDEGVKKTTRSRSDSTMVSCSAIVRRAASVRAVMQKSVSFRLSSCAARSIKAFVGSSTRKPSLSSLRRRSRFAVATMVTFRCQRTSNGLTFQHLDLEREIRPGAPSAGMLHDPNAFGGPQALAECPLDSPMHRNALIYRRKFFLAMLEVRTMSRQNFSLMISKENSRDFEFSDISASIDNDRSIFRRVNHTAHPRSRI